MARRPTHGFLATAAELRAVVRNNRLWHLAGDSGRAAFGFWQLRSFYLFHVYFTTRRILFEMGGFQRI